jgi:hypothetical protein
MSRGRWPRSPRRSRGSGAQEVGVFRRRRRMGVWLRTLQAPPLSRERRVGSADGRRSRPPLTGPSGNSDSERRRSAAVHLPGPSKKLRWAWRPAGMWSGRREANTKSAPVRTQVKQGRTQSGPCLQNAIAAARDALSPPLEASLQTFSSLFPSRRPAEMTPSLARYNGLDRGGVGVFAPTVSV